MASQREKYNLILQEVGRSGRQWDDAVELSVLVDETFADFDADSPLFSALAWKGNLVSANDLFVLTGEWQMNVPRQCSLCTVEFAEKMQGKIDVSYALSVPNAEEALELELSGDEPERLDSPGEINLLDVLREHFWLAWQSSVVCSSECKGLCLYCGIDLNHGECCCGENKMDNPFAALKNLKFDA